ncbi:hypothetical protein SK128_026678 [Halocaridina rubra]|uniref:BTB domain-containing protein n=1 Tax=Halocaridina rubra TaxID=373956 RepID=A0AAN8XHU9_HALRR
MGSEQHYSLRWNDYTVKIVTAFQSLRDEEDFVDVTVACDGHSYSAHKMVLSACSPYFRALLRANPCQHPIVILKDVGHIELERLLEFMYNGEVSIAQDQLAAFLKTAENLKIRGLAGSSDEMDHLGLPRPDVSYTYSSCAMGTGMGASGRSSPSVGYDPNVGLKDEEGGGDASGSYHTRTGSPSTKKRKKSSSTSASAAGQADTNAETDPTEVVGGDASVEIEGGGGGTVRGERKRKKRREPKSEPGDSLAEVYSESSEFTDPASQMAEGLDTRHSILYPLALPGPSGSAGSQDTLGSHDSGDVSALEAIANAVQGSAPSNQPMKCPLCMSIIKQARNLRRHVFKRHLPAVKRGEITEADVKEILERSLKAITVTPLTEEEMREVHQRMRKKGKKRRKGVASLPKGINGSNINESEVTIRKIPRKKDKSGGQVGSGGTEGRDDILQEAMDARDKDGGVIDLATGQTLQTLQNAPSQGGHSSTQGGTGPMSLTVTQTAAGVHARIPADAVLGSGVRLQADSPLPLHRDLPTMTSMAFEPQVTISEGMATYHTSSPSQVLTQTTSSPSGYTPPASYWAPSGMAGLSAGTFQAHQSVFAPTHSDYFAAGMHMPRPSALDRMPQHRRKPYQ